MADLRQVKQRIRTRVPENIQEDDTSSTAAEKVEDISSHPITPVFKTKIKLSLVDDSDGLPPHEKDLKKKERRLARRIQEHDASTSVPLSQSEITPPVSAYTVIPSSTFISYPISPSKQIVTTSDRLITSPHTSTSTLDHDHSQLFNLDISLTSTSMSNALHSPITEYTSGTALSHINEHSSTEPLRTKLPKSTSQLKRKVISHSVNYHISIDSDDDQWERDQLNKANGGRYTLPSSSSFLSHIKSFDKPDALEEQGQEYEPHTLRNIENKFTFHRLDLMLQELQERREEIESSLLATEEQLQKSVQTKALAIRCLDGLESYEKHSDEHTDFQQLTYWLHNIADFLKEKELAVSLAYEALEQLEQTYGYSLRFSNRCKTEKRTKFLLTIDAASLSKMGISTEGHLQLPNDIAWESDDSGCYNAECEVNSYQEENSVASDKERLLSNSRNTHNSEKRRWTLYNQKRENFCYGVLGILQDVNDDFHAPFKIVERYLAILHKYPSILHEPSFTSSLRDIFSFLVRLDILLWDPVLSKMYWSKGSPQPAPSIAGLSWHASLLQYTTELQRAIQDHHCANCKMQELHDINNVNIQPYLIFKFIVPRLSFWISRWWNPLSGVQSKRILLVLKDILGYKTTDYDQEVFDLLNLIHNRLRQTADTICTLRATEVSDQYTLHLSIWKAVKLACTATLFYGTAMNPSSMHSLIAESLCVNILKTLNSFPGTAPRSFQLGFITLATLIPRSTGQTLPHPVKEFLQSIVSYKEFPECVREELQKLYCLK